MFNRSLKWLAGAALAASVVAAAPSLTEAHAHYTGTLPPSLLAMATTGTPARHRTATVASHHRSAAKLAAKTHKVSKKHHKKGKKHKKS